MFEKYMSHHFVDEILASLRYTKREVHYEDGLFHMRQMEEACNKKKLVGGVEMLEDVTKDGKTFHIFCFKEPD